MKKKIFTAYCALALGLTVLFYSCSTKNYVDDVLTHDIVMDIIAALDDQLEYHSLDPSYVCEDAIYDDAYAVYSSDPNDINEIGIFHAKTENNAKELYEECLEYLEEMREDSRAFIASYAPTELPKLDKSRVYRFGNYVAYTVLADTDHENAMLILENRILVNEQ